MAFFFAIMISLTINAQSINGQMPLFPIVNPESLPEEALRNLNNKMGNIIASNGYGSCNYAERFVLVANVDVVSNSIAPTNPPKISKAIDITLIVGDIVENKTFASCVVSLNGIGINDNKAFITAFSSLKTNNTSISAMLSKAYSEISWYYGSNKEKFLNNAKAMELKGNFDEAIAYLMSVPPIDDICYQTCQDYAIEVYKSKVKSKSVEAYLSAKAAWVGDKSKRGAYIALPFLKQVNPASECYTDALALWDEISDKLDADEIEAKEIAKAKYQDKQKFKSDILDACKSIGVAFCEHRPQSVTRIIRGWF